MDDHIESEQEITLLFKEIDKRILKLPAELKQNSKKAKSQIQILFETAGLEIETFNLQYDSKEAKSKSEAFARQLSSLRDKTRDIIQEFEKKDQDWREDKKKNKKS